MPHVPCVSLSDESKTPVPDTALEGLLWGAYVEAGFTEPEVAKTAFRASAVRARGRLLVARESDGGQLVGMVMVVASHSAARRLAEVHEAELHLLAVSPAARAGGVGRALVEAALEQARCDGAKQVVLWTQPTMHAAQRLYERIAFVRAAQRDFEASGRAFMVYERPL